MGQGRTTNDEVLAACLATGVTVVEAAKAANVSASHAYRKCKEPEFAAYVRRLRADIVTLATARLGASMTKAADRLTALIDSADEKVSLQASRSVFELVLKARSAEVFEQLAADLESRMAAVEAKGSAI